jgi:hypothetical protein
MASPLSFRISPETLFGLTDTSYLPLLNFPNDFSANGEGLTELAPCMCGMLRSEPNTEEEYKLRELTFFY